MRQILFLSALLLLPLFAQADQTLKLPGFNAVKSDGIFDIEIVVGAAQSVIIKGPATTIAQTSFAVVDGELRIVGPEGKHGLSFTNDNKILITMPALRQFRGKGVGEVVINNVSGDRIDLAYEGVGSLEVSGKTKWLRLKGSGVGSIDTKKLLAEDADVDFDGVGGVEIYSSNHLNAVVHGVGSLTYYGKPKSINRQADGIGSISPGP